MGPRERDDRPSRSAASGTGSALRASAVPEHCAGFRVVRRLGGGERADVYLGIPPLTPGRREGVSSGSRESERRPSVALKVFHRQTEAASIERELRALSETTPGRLTGLLDVATLSDGRVCFVLERLVGQTLDRLLSNRIRRDRRGLCAGEAVTILAPVVATLAEFLALGLAYDGLDPTRVVLDAGGRPVLTGLGRLQSVLPPGPGRREQIDREIGQVKALALDVLSVVDQGGPIIGPNPALWLAEASTRLALSDYLETLERSLFAWTPAMAVLAQPARIVAGGEQVGRTIDWHLRHPFATAADEDDARSGMVVPDGSEPERAEPERAEPDDHESDGRRRELRDRLKRRIRPARGHANAAWLARLLLAGPSVDRIRAGLGAALHAHRGPVLLAGLVGATLAVVLLTLIGQPDGEFQDPPPARPTQGLAPQSEPPAAPVGEAGADRAALDADEPLEAVAILLRLRSGCLSAASVDCLLGVDQAGSAALEADGNTVRANGPGASEGTAQPDPAGMALIERTGNVALVAVMGPSGDGTGNAEPASVLVVKGEAGWRIREIFDY